MLLLVVRYHCGFMAVLSFSSCKNGMTFFADKNPVWREHIHGSAAVALLQRNAVCVDERLLQDEAHRFR